MKSKLNFTWALLLCVMFAIQFGLTSCNDDEGGSGVPVITGVRSCDPETADSLFNKASQGQIIAIIGKNLGHAKSVHINDQKVGFSTTMNTDHSIIVAVPSEADGFKLTAFSEGLKDEIRVETAGGVATYEFKVLTAAPSISRIQGIYPRKTGDVLKVFGSNLVSIEDMYFTDLTAEELATTTWETVGGNHVPVTDYSTTVMDHYLDNKTQAYTTTSQLAVTIPELPFDEGCLVIECAAGTRYIAFTKRPGKPVIKTVSSDMPVIGENLVITGNEFVQIESIQIGDYFYSPEEFEVADTEAEITIPITRIPAPGSDPVLVVTTPGGVATVENFYNYETLLNDFDTMINAGTATDEGWSPNADYGVYPEIGGTDRVAHIETAGGWWDQMVFFKKDWSGEPMVLPSFDVIPANAPADHIYLAFEVYDDNSDWNNGGAGYQGYLRLAMWYADNIEESAASNITYDNFAWDDYEAGTFKNPDGPCMQDVDGEAHFGKWYRSVIPFSKLQERDGDLNITALPFERGTYQDIVNKGIGIIRFMALNQGAKPGKMNFYMDNVRIIYIK